MEEILNSDKQYQQQSNNLKYASKFFHTKTLFGKNEQPRVIIAKKEQQTVLELWDNSAEVAVTICPGTHK